MVRLDLSALLALFAVGCQQRPLYDERAALPPPSASAAPAPSASASVGSSAASAGDPLPTPSGSAPTGLPRARDLHGREFKLAPAPGVPTTTTATAPTKLVAAGAEPRRPLRYRLQVGSTERVELITSTRVKMVLAGEPVPSPPVPELRMVLELKLLEQRAGGAVRRSLSVQEIGLVSGGPKLDPQIQAQLEEVVASMRTFRAEDELDPQGVAANLQLQNPASTDPQQRMLLDNMHQAFSQVTAPLPKEPVGVGAKWEVKTTLTQMGVVLTQVARYELVELRGDTGRTKVQLQQSAPPGAIDAKELPLGLATRIDRMESVGTGEVRFDLQRFAPGGQLENTSVVRMQTETGGVPQSVAIDSVVRVRFAPVAAKP